MEAIRTAEAVTPKHPDKICDRISDAILDAALTQDPESRVAVETMGGHGIITLTGEMTTKAYVDIPQVVRRVLNEGAADDQEMGVQVNIARQSPEISKGVDDGGAGDQGIMVGYATNEVDDFLPLEQSMARSICRFIYSHAGRRWETDGKVQVTVKGQRIHTIVASFCGIEAGELRDAVLQSLPAFEYPFPKEEITIMANPAGDWYEGGFQADTGLTGRKVVVDNYGPHVPTGGGAYSGKDATKVDRSGAYLARYLAKRYLNECVPKELISYVTCRLAYAIGYHLPVQCTIRAECYVRQADGSPGKLEMVVDVDEPGVAVWDLASWQPMLGGAPIFAPPLSPRWIREYFGLNRPIYEATAQWGPYGHYGFPWEQC